MAVNLERYRGDLDRLIELGHSLDLSMMNESDPTSFKKQAVAKVGADKAKELIEGLPEFNTAYEAWYSESLALLRQLLPDRLDDFVSCYERPKNRKELSHGNYVIKDYLQGLVRKNYAGDIIVSRSSAFPQFRQQLAIVMAAKARFESSIFEIRQLVQADLFDSEIEAARDLLKHNFLRAAGAIAGVVVEKHLRQVCDDHNLTITKKHPGINDLSELLKANSVISIPQWRHVAMLADIRNLCDHNKDREPSVEQVTDLIDGADKVLKTIA